MASQEWKLEVVRIAGIEMPVIKGGSGAPLLVLHDELGYAGWLNWQRALAKERTLVIPLAPGFGQSPWLPWIGNVRDLACCYARFLREQGIEPLNRDVIPPLRQFAKERGSTDPFECQPGSRPLAGAEQYQPITNAAALA